jgi:hypothetical protein
MKNSIIALTLSILSILAVTTKAQAAYYDRTNPALGNVPHCIHGSMTLQDNGVLVSQDGRTEDFHQLMSNASIQGVPDRINNSLKAGQVVVVCQNGGRLQFNAF